MADVIGTPALRAEFDGRAVVQGAKETGARLKTTFEESNRNVEKIQRDASRRIQRLISTINAEKPRRQMFELAHAVHQLGGTANLTEQQLAKVRREVERLTAAGAKAPKSLAGVLSTAPGGGVLGTLGGAAGTQIQGSLTGQAGGLAGVLGAVGPAGLAAAAGVGAFVGSMKGLADLSERGTAVLGVRNSFRALADDSEALLAASRRATRGMISDFDLMQTANKGMLLGLPITAQEMETLGKTAVALGRAMNVGPTQALQDLITGLGRGSAAILDNLGITVKAADAYERYAASVGKNASDLTAAEQKLAIYKAALEAANGAVAAVGQTQETAGDSGKRLEAAWQNLKDALATGVTESEGATNAWGGLADAMQSVADLLNNEFSQQALGAVARALAAVATGGLTEIVKGYKDLKAELGTQFGDLGAAPGLTDTRRGSIFEPQGLGVPKGPAEWELERDAQRERAAQEATRAEKELAAERLKTAHQATRAAVEAERESLELRQKLVAGALGGPAGGPAAAGPVQAGALGGVRDWEQARYEQAIKLAQAAQTSGLSLEQIRTRLEGMGLSSDEATGILEKHLKAQEEVKKSTTDWSGQLADLANLMQGMGGIAGKFGNVLAGVASSISGLGSFLSRLKGGEGGGLGKSVTGFLDKLGLGKIGSALGKVVPFAGAALSVVSLGKSLFGGIKSLFGGKSKEQKEAERQAKEEAARAKAEAEKQARITARQNLEQGLGTARTAAESLMARLAQGGLSEGLTKALQTLIGKVGDALLRTGLGILDGRLQESEAFTESQRTAGDIATVIQGMRQAGMIDEGLLGAAGAAAGEVQQQAIDAALAAGLSPEEAARAGSAAIAPLLREQLNASLQSGKELDENTKALLEEARKNGIEILADPAIEQLDVSKKQLGVLERIAGKPGAAGLPTTPAAKGVGPFVSKSEGLIHYHPNELIWVLPKAMQPGGVISAARGLYDLDPDGLPRDRELPGDTTEAAAATTTTAIAESVGIQVAAALLPELRRAVVEAAPVQIAPQITINEDPEGDKETRTARRRQTVENVADAFQRREPALVIAARRALMER